MFRILCTSLSPFSSQFLPCFPGNTKKFDQSQRFWQRRLKGGVGIAPPGYHNQLHKEPHITNQPWPKFLESAAGTFGALIKHLICFSNHLRGLSFFLQLVNLSGISSKRTLLSMQSSEPTYEEAEGSFAFLLLPGIPCTPELLHHLTF